MQRGRHRQRGCHQRVDGSSLSTEHAEKETNVILNGADSRGYPKSLPLGVRVHTLTRCLLPISQGCVTKWFVIPRESRSVGTRREVARLCIVVYHRTRWKFARKWCQDFCPDTISGFLAVRRKCRFTASRTAGLLTAHTWLWLVLSACFKRPSFLQSHL